MEIPKRRKSFPDRKLSYKKKQNKTQKEADKRIVFKLHKGGKNILQVNISNS